MSRTLIPRGSDKIKTVKSQIFNVDNGAGTTIDETIMRSPRQIELVNARIVYDTETAGTVAGANARIGVAVGGATVVASTALTNSAAVGATTAMTLLIRTIAAGTPLIVRHTGIATTAAGQYHVELDYQEL